jgi:hypothetical protein
LRSGGKCVGALPDGREEVEQGKDWRPPFYDREDSYTKVLYRYLKREVPGTRDVQLGKMGNVLFSVT